MIYIDYQPLQHILNMDEWPQDYRLTILDREKIRSYRDTVLEQQCEGLIIIKAPQGKPIAQSHPNFEFNHSHSQKYYALAYSHDVKDLGIDIEDFSRSVKMEALAKRNFHPQEYQTWQLLNQSKTYWFKVWTIKEAVLKANGLGIALELKSLNTQAHPTTSRGRVDHPQIGSFEYQCLEFEASMLTVAYRPNASRNDDLTSLILL